MKCLTNRSSGAFYGYLGLILPPVPCRNVEIKKPKYPEEASSHPPFTPIPSSMILTPKKLEIKI
jgi:hypothetical protein